MAELLASLNWVKVEPVKENDTYKHAGRTFHFSRRDYRYKDGVTYLDAQFWCELALFSKPKTVEEICQAHNTRGTMTRNWYNWQFQGTLKALKDRNMIELVERIGPKSAPKYRTDYYRVIKDRSKHIVLEKASPRKKREIPEPNNEYDVYDLAFPYNDQETRYNGYNSALSRDAAVWNLLIDNAYTGHEIASTLKQTIHLPNLHIDTVQGCLRALQNRGMIRLVSNGWPEGKRWTALVPTRLCPGCMEDVEMHEFADYLCRNCRGY